LVGLRHEAQYLAGLLDVVPFRRGVFYKEDDGEVRRFDRLDMGGCVKKLPILVTRLRTMGYIADGQFGDANAIIGPAKVLLERMTDMLRKNPEQYLCDDVVCLWCRELERRMGLYRRRSPAHLFQRSPFVRDALAVINWFRLRNIKEGQLQKWVARGKRLPRSMPQTKVQ